MTALTLYMLCGAVLLVLGLFSLFTVSHLVRKILALNVMSAGVFMVLVSLGHPARDPAAAASVDPVPHALVLTGIVVAVSATALALGLTCRYHADTGQTELPEDLRRDGRSDR